MVARENTMGRSENYGREKESIHGGGD